jgi:ubiquinol-cytochrome c reductase cytochrome b subunit
MGVARRMYGWLDERLGISSALLPILRHPVPKSVNWWYVFGSATLVAFLVQVVTGVALAFSYVPAPNSAFQSIDFITHHETLGHVVRGIHFWGASAMVILIAVHAARTFVMGSYKYPRELNWLSGVMLLFLTLGMAFTGQLLRWDQDAYWAVVVAAEQAGRVPLVGHALVRLVVAGQTVGGNTLTRFYATHVFLLPALIFALIGGHLYLVVRNGISEPPRVDAPVDPKTERERYRKVLEREGVPFWPDAAWRDVVFALAVGVVVVGLAVTLGPKTLSEQADPTVLKASPRPDWYFLWLFALLALIPPRIEDWFIVGLPLLGLIVLLAVPFVSNKGTRAPRHRPWALATVLTIAVAGIVLVQEGKRAPWSPDLGSPTLPASVTTPAEAAGVDPGANLFESHGCINCHTVAGSGGERGPDLTTAGNRLSPDQMTTRILNGGHNMPAYANNLTPEQVQQLVAFLQAQRGP